VKAGKKGFWRLWEGSPRKQTFEVWGGRQGNIQRQIINAWRDFQGPGTKKGNTGFRKKRKAIEKRSRTINQSRNQRKVTQI